jgi:hypothetical protein
VITTGWRRPIATSVVTGRGADAAGDQVSLRMDLSTIR